MNLNFRQQLAGVALLAASVSTVAFAQSGHEGHGHRHPAEMTQVASGPHGGSLRQTGGIQVETVVSQGGIQMYVFDRSGQPVSVDGGRGAASVRISGNAKRYRYDLLPDGKGALTALVNLSAVAGRQIEVDIQLVGIPATGSRPIAFQEVASVPASEQQLAAAAIARQKICPVSGRPLGSMGDPVAVEVNGQRLFVCCGGCIKKIQAEPAKYLAMVYGTSSGGDTESGSVPAGREQVREGIFKVVAADAPFIAAQQRCPVMDEPLDAMGGPYKVNAAGKAIYICCPGCAKKIATDPQKYLGILAKQGVHAPILR